jgi:hypothetical protein
MHQTKNPSMLLDAHFTYIMQNILTFPAFTKDKKIIKLQNSFAHATLSRNAAKT